MKNIPVFTTEHGVASLTLDQIAFNSMAYIRIQSSAESDFFIKECLDFCKAVGAKTVYATGSNSIKDYISVVSLIRMKRKREGLPETTLSVVPVDTNNADQFRKIYNEKMRGISHASAMTHDNLEMIVKQKNGRFFYKDHELQGIGIADDKWIRAIISLKRGAGESILLALNQMLQGEEVNVELVDTNTRAKRLYERMGFQLYETVSTWYKIL